MDDFDPFSSPTKPAVAESSFPANPSVPAAVLSLFDDFSTPTQLASGTQGTAAASSDSLLGDLVSIESAPQPAADSAAQVSDSAAPAQLAAWERIQVKTCMFFRKYVCKLTQSTDDCVLQSPTGPTMRSVRLTTALRTSKRFVFFS
jgi:hypothetical protein